MQTAALLRSCTKADIAELTRLRARLLNQHPSPEKAFSVWSLAARGMRLSADGETGMQGRMFYTFDPVL